MAETYTELPNNTFTKLVSKGIDPKTGIDMLLPKHETKPLPILESLYLTNTDALIGALDGSLSLNSVETPGNVSANTLMVSNFDGKPADHAIYLDKSARPIEYLVAGLWDKLASNGTPMPESSFLNIDKEQWLTKMGFPDSDLQDIPIEEVNLELIDKELLEDSINRLRALYLSPENLDKIDENDLSQAWNYPTTLDGKNVMIVDEVFSSGNTLYIAQMLLEKAFPETTFSSTYWAKPNRVSWEYLEDGELKKSFCAEYAPVWYNDETTSGRGIDDIDPQYSKLSPDKRQRIGQFILSTPYHEPGTTEVIVDPKSTRIYDDLRLLIDRVYEGKVLYRPAGQRPFSQFKQRAVTLNPDVSNFEEYVKKIRAIV